MKMYLNTINLTAKHILANEREGAYKGKGTQLYNDLGELKALIEEAQVKARDDR